MDGSPDSGAILDQSDPAAITLWGMAKHSLTLSSTKHIILHYRLEPQCTQIYKHQGLINKLFTRVQFGTRLNNIKSDNVSVQVSGQWVIRRRYSSCAVHMAKNQCDACSYQCFVSSGYAFHHIPLQASLVSSYSFIGLQLAGFLLPFSFSHLDMSIMSDLILWVQTAWKRQLKRESTSMLLEYYTSPLCYVSSRWEILVEKYPGAARVGDLSCDVGCLVPGERYLSQIE